nr:glutamate racemase [uncultured bacterium]
MSEFPIGIFDSGIGGLTIQKKINNFLPNENLVYYSDSFNSPYGNKSGQELDEICFKNCEFLVNKKCKLIVVACNTATTNCIKKLRSKFNVPFVGVEPAIKPAAKKTKSGKIGVLATEGTLRSKQFNNISEIHTKNVKVIEENAKGLVELIERGIFKGQDLRLILIKHLNRMIEIGIDQLVLGCTHFPLIIDEIKKIIPPKISILESSDAVAKQTKRVLKENNLIKNEGIGNTTFYCNGPIKSLNKILNYNFEIIRIKI